MKHYFSSSTTHCFQILETLSFCVSIIFLIFFLSLFLFLLTLSFRSCLFLYLFSFCCFLYLLSFLSVSLSPICPVSFFLSSSFFFPASFFLYLLSFWALYLFFLAFSQSFSFSLFQTSLSVNRSLLLLFLSFTIGAFTS